MKVGYPDTINSGNSSASPFKMVDTSKADLDKDGKVSEYEGNRAEAAFGDTPINMNGPLYAKEPKKTKVGRTISKVRDAIAARKKRRNDGENDNPKAKEREIGRITRKANKKQNKKDIKTEKAKVTKARQDKRTAKATTRQTKRLDKVTKKVVKKVEDVKKGTGLGVSKDNPAVGNIVKEVVKFKNKKK